MRALKHSSVCDLVLDLSDFFAHHAKYEVEISCMILSNSRAGLNSLSLLLLTHLLRLLYR